MKLNHCPVCAGQNFSSVVTAKDQLVSGAEFNLDECSSCSLRFTNPRPDDDQLPAYYDSADYISHTNRPLTLTDRLYKIARGFTLKNKRRLIAKINRDRNQARLLDVGCGTGHFLASCQEHGWQIIGVEPNATARQQATTLTGSSIYQDLQNIHNQQFEVITLWHVLEHVPDLAQTMQTLTTLMATKGSLIIAVPNYRAYEAGKFGGHWAAYDVPRHLYHFTRQAMHTLAAKHGLKIVQTHPMWLDSFYISLLSNQHKNKRNNYLGSFITGLLSNIYALKSGDFSSLIYHLVKNDQD